MIGFIAQEVMAVIPDAVSKAANGFYQLNVDPIHWAVVNAVKQLAAKVAAIFSVNEENERKISSLEKENHELRAWLERLEKTPAPALPDKAH
jgi:hypothetical protein